MKVLMLAPWHSIHARRPLDLLLRSGCQVVFVGREDMRTDRPDRYEFRPYPQTRWERSYRRLFKGRIGGWLKAGEITLRLARLGRAVRPDVVHVHWVDHRAYRCARAGLRPLVLSVWGSDVNKHLQPTADPYRRRLAGRALAAADLVIVDAPEMPEKCRVLAGRPVPTRLLSLGIDTALFRPGHAAAVGAWRRRLQIPDSARVLLSVRGFGRNYGHHLILEAFAEATRRSGRETVLIFVLYNRGVLRESAQYEMELKRRADELGIRPRVRWIEPIPHARLPELYAASDIVVNFPSMDAFPVTFLEAAACERPVISARLPAYRGTFAETHFRMVEPGHVTGLADAMVELVDGSPGAGEGSLAGARQIVEREYDESIYVSELLDIYQRLSRNRGLGLDREASRRPRTEASR